MLVGFYIHSLALIADAFHYLNDFLSFMVALVAVLIAERGHDHQQLSFGWQRAQLLGAFFNGVFLSALGLSIFLQSIERFIALQKVENPKYMLTVGCVGFLLNVISALFLHEHGHGPPPEVLEEYGRTEPDQRDSIHLTPRGAHHEHRHKISDSGVEHHHDLGMMSVLVHIAGDALNNIGVVLAAVIMWQTHYAGRYYADPAVSMGISIMILFLAIPPGEYNNYSA